MASTIGVMPPGAIVAASTRRPLPPGRRWKAIRFPAELWVICFVVSLGAVQSFSLGFYQFRLSDLVLDLAALYCGLMFVHGRLPRAVRVLLVAYLAVLVGRVLLEGVLIDPHAARTLLGMGAAYAAPLVFFAAREARTTRRVLSALLFTGCVVCLLSQMGVLSWGESYAAGTVDLASFLGIARPEDRSLGYQETTITIWRALSVGLTLAALVSRSGLLVKCLGLVGVFLQFTGGGGSRSQALFLLAAPLAMFLRPAAAGALRILRKLPIALATTALFVAVYLWAPVGGSLPVHGKYLISHYDRASEILVVFTGGWSAAAETSGAGFEGRVAGWETYWNGIVEDARVFWIGTGLSLGAGFADTVNILAHNPILDVWAISGLFGLAFFLCFMAFIVRDLWLLLKVIPKGGGDELLGLSVAGAVMYMFQWLLFQAVTADRSFMIVFYLLSGLLLPTARLLSGAYKPWSTKNSGVAFS